VRSSKKEVVICRSRDCDCTLFFLSWRTRHPDFTLFAAASPRLIKFNWFPRSPIRVLAIVAFALSLSLSLLRNTWSNCKSKSERRTPESRNLHLILASPQQILCSPAKHLPASTYTQLDDTGWWLSEAPPPDLSVMLAARGAEFILIIQNLSDYSN
jgi:hypothetical protein